MIRHLFALLVSLLWATASIAGERVALVIGNSNYMNPGFNDLENPAHDATDISRTLQSLGFRVSFGLDLTRAEMLSLTQEVQKSLAPDDIAMFYYAGHAVQLGAENYLSPVDAQATDLDAIRNSSVKLQTILAEMESKADRNIIILDACRNNPISLPGTARSTGGMSRGLAKVDAGVGSFIAFSTQPGNVAQDGVGRNSPFTQALLQHLPSTDDDLHEVMRKVRRDVYQQTDGIQIPWENSSLIDQVFLAGRAAPSLPQTTPSPLPAPTAIPQPQTAGQFTHQVAGLDPNGDGFLALRSGTTSSAARLMKMTEGTRLQVLGQDGVWFLVRTSSGAQGWAHSNWIRFTGVRAAPTPQTCDTLWMQRNAIFARNGYCFQSTRGRRAFSNQGCRVGVSAGQIPLTPAERQEVLRLKSLDSAQGCR